MAALLGRRLRLSGAAEEAPRMFPFWPRHTGHQRAALEVARAEQAAEHQAAVARITELSPAVQEYQPEPEPGWSGLEGWAAR